MHNLPTSVFSLSEQRYWTAKVSQLVKQFPDLETAATQAAKSLLARLGAPDIDPHTVYWHYFKGAVSSSRTFTGWAHIGKPEQSMTLVELVMRRFTPEQQRNGDLLHQMGGFYTADEHAHHYNETNEVRLDPRLVHKDLWKQDFAEQYRARLKRFWKNQESFYHAVSKTSALFCALLQTQRGKLSREDFLAVYGAVVNDPSTPFMVNKLTGPIASHSSTLVRALDVAGYRCQGILRFCVDNGRQILYCPQLKPHFVVVANDTQLYAWVQEQLQDKARRRHFRSLFKRFEPMGNQHSDVLEGFFDAVLKTPWSAGQQLLNVEDRALDGYAFDYLTTGLKINMEQEASYLLTSNLRLEKDLWIGYLNTFLELYGVMSVMGWPVAAATLAASAADVALYTDKAIEARSSQERMQAIHGAVIQSLTLLLTLPLLRDVHAMDELEGLAAQAEDAFDTVEISEPAEARDESSEGDLAVAQEYLSPWRPVVLIDRELAVITDGDFSGLYVRRGDEAYARIGGTLYRVRYVDSLSQWAVVDPLNPYGDSCIPLIQNAQGIWRAQALVRLFAATESSAGGWATSAAAVDTEVTLQPHDSPIEVTLPLDGMEQFIDSYMVRTQNRGPLLAVFDADAQAWRADHLGNRDFLWRTPASTWRSGGRAQWLEAKPMAPKATKLKTVVLPPLPSPCVNPKPIPKVVHYVWIGGALDQALIDNLQLNATRMQGYRSVLHVDLDTATALTELRGKLAGQAGLEVKALMEEPFFQRLRLGDDAAHYAACRRGAGSNLAAASDLVRYPLLDAYGGIYMDIDNTFTATHKDVALVAGPHDVLLDDAVVHSDIPYSGYNSHVLGSHPNNPVLKAISRSIRERFAANPTFYAKPRPVLAQNATAADAEAFWRYMRESFAMTGPTVLDDVLRQVRPDYYDLALRPEIRKSLGITSSQYEQRLETLVDHYLPFADKVEVKVGNLHSWKLPATVSVMAGEVG